MMRNTYLYYLLVLVAFLSACERAEESIMPEQFSLEDAKQWFEQEIALQPNAQIPLKRIIDWQNAKQRTFQDNLPVWIVPIRYEDGSVMAMIQDDNEQKITNPEKIEASGIQVEEILILFERNDTGKKAWTAQLMPEAISTDPTKLSGYVVVKDWQGKFVKAYDYVGGNVVREYANNNFSNARVTDCLTKTIDWWSVGIDNATGTQYWQFMYTETKWVCTGTASSYSGGGSGGAGSKWFIDGDFSFNTTMTDELLGKITGTNYLNRTQKGLLKEAFEDFMDRGCLTRHIYNQLVARNIRVSFKMEPNLPADAGYKNGTIYFHTNADIIRESLMEELFHAYQSNVIPGGIEQFIGKAGISNIEFEAGLIHDMMELVEPSGYKIVYFGMPEESMFFTSYRTWLGNITKQGTAYPRSIDLPAYFEQVRSFKSANSTHQFYDAGFSPTMKPETLLNLTNGSNCK